MAGAPQQGRERGGGGSPHVASPWEAAVSRRGRDLQMPPGSRARPLTSWPASRPLPALGFPRASGGSDKLPGVSEPAPSLHQSGD